jgi:hypothetical protein
MIHISCLILEAKEDGKTETASWTRVSTLPLRFDLKVKKLAALLVVCNIQ